MLEIGPNLMSAIHAIFAVIGGIGFMYLMLRIAADD